MDKLLPISLKLNFTPNTVKPGLCESQGTAENIRITQTFVQLRLSMYRRGFRRDQEKIRIIQDFVQLRFVHPGFDYTSGCYTG